MGRMGSTTSVRARQMRGELARWQRSGLKLRVYGQQHGIPLSTLTWWRQVFRHAGEQGNAGSEAAAHRTAILFLEMKIAIAVDIGGRDFLEYPFEAPNRAPVAD